MDVITKDVRALAKKELAAANRRFRMFASPHEGYAVIREELDELIDEVRKLHFGLTIRLWRDVKRNEPMKREHLNLIYDVAIHAAVEAIMWTRWKSGATRPKNESSFIKTTKRIFSSVCGFVTRCGRAWTHFGSRTFRLHLSTRP